MKAQESVGMAVANSHEIISFGTFEVDLDAEEVRKAGLRIRLAGQPFRLLAVLLSHPGEIVTREELKREIWESNTVVDFERGIASAVNKLREALGDSADHPLYIETLARRGYRFIAPVTALPRPSALLETASDPAHPPLPVHHPHEMPAGIGALGKSTSAPGIAVSDIPVQANAPRNSASVSHRFRRFTFIAAPAVLAGITAFWAGRFLGRSPTALLPHIEQLTDTNDLYAGPPNPENLLAMQSDGPRLFVPTLLNGESQITSLASNGSSRESLNLPENLSTGALSDISEDGSRLLVRSRTNRETEQPLWIVPTSGSGAQRVGEVLAHDAAWIPNDPDHILIATGTDIHRLDLGTDASTPLISLPGPAFWMRWSPDGRTLRFTVLNPMDHTSQLWESDGRSGHPHPLAFEQLRGLNLCCGSWTPSGKSFVFQASNARDSNLWLAEGGFHPHLRQLTNGPIRMFSPLPGRDGRVVFAFGSAESASIQRYDRERHEFVPADPYLRDAERVSFSQDAAWVAWTDSRGHLWRAHAGRDILQLTPEDLEVFSAQWSPDDRKLLLMGRRPGEPWRIYTVNNAGGAVTPLFADDRNVADPSWSPDGRQVVFGREAELMGTDPGPHNIEIFDTSTHKIHALPNSMDLFSPRWSPDGQWIAALSRDQARLVVFNIHTQTWTTLYSGGAADPVWARDSRSIVFHAFAPEHTAILRADVESQSIETVVDLTKFDPSIFDDCFFSGLMPDGSPLIKPRVGSGNLYSVALPSD